MTPDLSICRKCGREGVNTPLSGRYTEPYICDLCHLKELQRVRLICEAISLLLIFGSMAFIGLIYLLG